jgi:very-short-patch-repair endonuclease
MADQLPVGGYKVDVAFVKQKVAIEVDGLAHHSDSEDFHNDRVRQNSIVLLGWQVLRFTWLDLVEYPQRFIAVIRSATSERKQSLTGCLEMESHWFDGSSADAGRCRLGG